MYKLLILFILSFVIKLHANEIKPLSELKIIDFENYSLHLMERCSVLYAALSILENNNDYENKYKIFLQSSILSKKKLYPDEDEETLYKNSLQDFKLTLSFFLQILKQNYSKNKSYLSEEWLVDDFNTCIKL